MEEKQYTVLLVEDSKLVLLKTARFLKENGFKVITAEDGQIAIDIYKVRFNEIDVIVSDLMMPNVDGYDFALFNYNNDRLPFVAYTVINDAASAMKLLGRGVYFYVQKPFVPGQFLAYILGAIHRWEFNKDIRKSESVYSGNLDSITINSTKAGLKDAMNWFSAKNEEHFDEDNFMKVVHNFNEILINSYEHGSLGITEEEKSKYIQEGVFDKIVENREKTCTKQMVISQTTLKDQIAVSIKDEGNGFNYKKYLEMTPDVLLERINMPNGRGIYICAMYFDKIEYSDGGSRVMVVKSF
ncbi:MAG: response regulator [Nitrospinae bacterium]|nr:response regulator [Nitrospinota bacterium]